MIRLKRHRWNKDGTKETHLLYKTKQQYQWLKPFDFIPVEKNIGNVWFENYPYRWYEISYLWEYPAEEFFNFLKKYINIDLSNLTITKAVIKIIMFLVEVISVWLICKILDSIC